jgi:hypothetical protein
MRYAETSAIADEMMALDVASCANVDDGLHGTANRLICEKTRKHVINQYDKWATLNPAANPSDAFAAKSAAVAEMTLCGLGAPKPKNGIT